MERKKAYEKQKKKLLVLLMSLYATGHDGMWQKRKERRQWE